LFFSFDKYYQCCSRNNALLDQILYLDRILDNLYFWKHYTLDPFD
jgi:hypothetical protein